MQVMKYLHTMVRVTDIEASLRFYRDALGLELLSRRDSEPGRYTLVFLAAPGNRDAQIELDTAEVAFRYRYTTVRPARLPRKPDAPNVVLLVAGALVAGLGAGVVRAVFQELRAQALLSPEALAAYLTAPPPSASAS